MDHPTTLGACRNNNRQLFKQHDKQHCARCVLCVIQGARNRFLCLSRKHTDMTAHGLSLHLTYFPGCLLNAITVSPVLLSSVYLIFKVSYLCSEITKSQAFYRHDKMKVIQVEWILICTHQQFTSGYNKYFFSRCVVVGFWCPNSEGKSEHKEGPHCMESVYVWDLLPKLLSTIYNLVMYLDSFTDWTRPWPLHTGEKCPPGLNFLYYFLLFSKNSCNQRSSSLVSQLVYMHISLLL